MAQKEFSPIPERPKEIWVQGLSVKGRADYDLTRVEEIDEHVEGITALFRSISDFKGVSNEAVGYMALRLATALRNYWEDGFQQGTDNERARSQRELEDYQLREGQRLDGGG